MLVRTYMKPWSTTMDGSTPWSINRKLHIFNLLNCGFVDGTMDGSTPWTIMDGVLPSIHSSTPW